MLHCVALPCVLHMMQRAGGLNFTVAYSTIVYPTLLSPDPTLRYKLSEQEFRWLN